MLRFSKLADYAVVVLARLADGAAVQTSPGIAAATGVPEPTVAKVLKILAGGGLVLSQRGARGGYRLARPLTELSVAQIVATVDGPIALTACVDGSTSDCEASCRCALHGRWGMVNDAVRDTLTAITLSDMLAAPMPARPAPRRPAAPATHPAAE